MTLKEACGVVAAYSEAQRPVSTLIVRALEALQHRGQESWGLAVHGGLLLKRMGVMIEGYAQAWTQIESMKGASGIGHVRYSTKGRSTIQNAHPIHIDGEFFIAQNGTISNFHQVAEKFPEPYATTTDTEVAGRRLLNHYRAQKNWFSAFEKLAPELSGAYCFVMLTKQGHVLAARDEGGFRPLCLGWHEESQSHIIASESSALDVLHARLVRDVEPGELILIDEQGLHSRQFAKAHRHHHCPFEYTYFAHPSSLIENRSVYESRRHLGRILARKYSFKADVVIPVPDSARPAALGYSEASRIPLEEGLMKDRYRRRGTLRSFIEPTEGSREDIVKQIITIKPVLDGKDVIVVDDSIVRGTSSRQIVRALRDAGARKVYFVITFPPIRHPCYMGIDFPTEDELVAYRVGEDAATIPELNRLVAKEVGADGVGYNDLDGLSEGLAMARNELCTSCVNGDYSHLKHPLIVKSRAEMKA